jgi:2-polyprenyl-3-methyl-5-hydroxy-6-metoxy-1,4-benzoquinol methylase
MERLQFNEKQELQPLEAAIHINRYLLAKQFCQGKKVLDIACGQGYGSFLMAHNWGADFVAGVDISTEAIDAANQYFKHEKVEFYCHSAENVNNLFSPESFDVIISLETIEHITDPKPFLQSLKQLLKPDGIIILSCPNDHWYFPNEDQKNPFHVRKYTFDEFKNIAESVLGAAQKYMLGTPIAGFVNFSMEDPLIGRSDANQRAMIESHSNVFSEVVPTNCMINPASASYFVGLWGSKADLTKTTAAFYPHSMDNEDLEILRKEVILGKDDIWKKDKMIKELENENRHIHLKLAAIKSENEYIREEQNKIADELQHARRLLQAKVVERIIIAVKSTAKKIYNKFK